MNFPSDLIEQALKARQNAYVPYSKYAVGAALWLHNWQILTGVNVENVSFGLTLCAERSAVVHAVSQGHRRFKALVVATDSEPPGAPCGACRQVLAEFEPELPILLTNTKGVSIETNLAQLLPSQFRF